MSRLAFLGLGLLLALGNAGCHNCSPCMDCYGDLIDDIGECQPELDCLYHPELDVSRIGQPDWCSCPFNHCIGGCECAQWNFPGVQTGRCDKCGRCTKCPGHAAPYPHYVMPNRVAPKMYEPSDETTNDKQITNEEQMPTPAVLPPPAPAIP